MQVRGSSAVLDPRSFYCGLNNRSGAIIDSGSDRRYHSSSMSDLTNIPPAGNGGDEKPIVQHYSHSPVAARVPERVAKGAYSTGQLVLDSPKEFIIDFLQGLTRPHQVVARVVLTPQTMQEFVKALQTNLDSYSRMFGAPPPLPPPPTQNRPNIEEIYQNFKLPEELMNGTYANSVLIGHGVTEFFFDFISGFYPNPAVGARIFMAAPQIPRFLTMLNTAIQGYQARYLKKPEPPAPEQL
jgi:uncharacterized protein DUF3467